MQRSLTPLLLVAATACGGLRQLTFTPPAVTVTEVAVTGLGLSGGSLRIAVRIANPNAYALASTAGALDLALDGTPFGTIELVDAVRVPARGEVTTHLPMTFTWAGVGAGARAMLGRGAVPYRLGGRLDADTPVGRRVVEVDVGGTVTLADLMR